MDNVVCRGTLMTDRFLGRAARSGLPPGECARRAAVPVRRIGRPEVFANVAVVVASERASFVTGAARQIDGGLGRTTV